MWRRGVLAAVVAALLLAVVAPSTAATAADSDLIMRRLNEHRVRHGLPRLIRDPQVDKVAQRWAERMAAERRMSHNPNVGKEMPPSSAWGENVAYGPDAERVFKAWRDSPPHNRNMLDKRFTRVGVGTAWADDTLYAVQDFMTPEGGETQPPPTSDSPPRGEPEPDQDPLTELVCSISPLVHRVVVCT